MAQQAHFLIISKIRHPRVQGIIREIRERLIATCGERIKLPGIQEPYVTLVPPFVAETGQARFFNLGVKVVATIHEQSRGGMLAQLGSTGFFENLDEDAFFFRIIYPEQFTCMIGALRGEIGNLARWAYEPKGSSFMPHMTICTGPGICSLLEKTNQSEDSIYPIDEPISTPELWVRLPGQCWTPVEKTEELL